MDAPVEDVSGEAGYIRTLAAVALNTTKPIRGEATGSLVGRCDTQNWIEHALHMMPPVLSGGGMFNGLGSCYNACGMSAEMIVIHSDLARLIERLRQGIEVTDDTLALDLILAKAPGEDFLAEMHTVEHMRTEFFTPRISNRDRRDTYDAAQSATAGARAFVEQVRSEAPTSRIDGAVRKQILKRFPEIRG